MVKGMVFTLLVASLSLTFALPKGVAVKEEASKVLKGAGCTCEEWEGISFCRGKSSFGGWQTKRDGVLFYCQGRKMLVPFSNIIAK